jgi:hypothetical protein
MHPSPALTTNLRRRSMKLVKKFVLAVLFVSALAVNVNAGDLETPTFASPKQSTSSTIAQDSDGTVDTSNELIYDAWAALLSLF